MKSSQNILRQVPIKTVDDLFNDFVRPWRIFIGKFSDYRTLLNGT